MRCRALLLLGALTAPLLLSSCAAPGAYYRDLGRLTAEGRFSDAASLAETSKDKAYGDKNALLYHFDRGMLLHLAGSYRESNIAFERAKRVADQYFTKSLATEASTLLVSDNMRPYYGEDFERALIHLFCALNYVFLGEESEALVEARQVDQFLASLKTKYDYQNVYKEDAFVRYLMGMLYENQGNLNDAFISYWKALESYGESGAAVPGSLVGDALRLARRLGLTDDVMAIQRRWGDAVPAPSPKGHGEVVVLHYNGESPVKTDQFFEVSFGKAWLHVDAVKVQGEDESRVEQAAAIARGIFADEQVRLAFPSYLPSSHAITSFSVSLEATDGVVVARARGENVEDIGAVAVRSLNDRIARVRARTIARAAIKFALSQNIGQTVQKKSDNEVLGWMVKKALKIASTATELSDKRSWRSLPDVIAMARLAAPAGTYAVRLTFMNAAGATVTTRTAREVTVVPGRKAFTVIRTVE